MSSNDPSMTGHHHPEPSSMPTSPSPFAAESAMEATEEMEAKFHYKQELKRGMTLVDLTLFGINWMAPLGPVVIWGIMLVTAGGAVGLSYALAGISMIFTAAGYAILAPQFPLAGSAYNYISKGWNPYIGFMVGWVMIADYLLFPASTTVSVAYYTQQIFPSVDRWIIIGVFGIFTGVLNIVGVDIMRKAGMWLLIVSEIVVFAFFVVCSVSAAGGQGFGTVLTLQPMQFSTFGNLMTATTLAVFNYLGFDAVTTMAEECNNPIQDIPKAVYMSVIIGASTMIGLGYFGQLPLGDAWMQFADQSVPANVAWVNTALYQVAVIAGGQWFGVFFYLGMLNSIAVFNVVSTASAARLVYGMGRDELLPKRIFGAINKRFQTPHWNIVIIVVLIFLQAALLPLDVIAFLINFGALTGFFMMNVLVLVMYFIKKNGVGKYKPGTAMYFLRYGVVSFVGVIVIGYTWLNLTPNTKWFGFGFAIVGLILLAFKTKGFRKLPPILEV
jgi:putrescine importer